MKTWTCTCGATLHFRNLVCLACGRVVGLDPRTDRMSTVETPDGDTPQTVGAIVWPESLKACSHRHAAPACNWLVSPADVQSDPTGRCLSCRLTEIAPDQAVAGNDLRWARIERAKRRVLRALAQWGRAPWDAPNGDPGHRPPLRFHFLAGTPEQPVLTGHADGLVTLNIAEADDVERERRRAAFDEPWRTLQGHLRHELGHWVQWRDFSGDAQAMQLTRDHFGDERADYGEALKRHHSQGAPLDWAQRHISPYAASHPWEDWAETCAHVLLVRDTLETAGHWGVRMDDGGVPRDFRLAPATSDVASPDPQPAVNFQAVLVERWMPLARMLTALDRSIGLRDPYPFTLSDPVLAKMAVVHDLLERSPRTLSSTST